MVRWLIEEGKADVNAASTDGVTPLLASLRATEVDTDVPRFLLTVGARVRGEDLDDPVFNGFVMGWICEEMQKLEVHIRTLLCTVKCWYLIAHFVCIC
jgi:hypothetical protein